MRAGVKTAKVSDVGDRILGIQQELFGMIQPQGDQILLETHAEIVVKKFAHIVLGKP